MEQHTPISRVINLISGDTQRLWSSNEAAIKRAMLAGDIDAVLGIQGSFALLAQDGERIVLARSLERPMRYFLAKSVDGPVLIVADRIDEIARELGRRGWSEPHRRRRRGAPRRGCGSRLGSG